MRFHPPGVAYVNYVTTLLGCSVPINEIIFIIRSVVPEIASQKHINNCL